MEVDLDLAELCVRMEERGRPVRLVGGAAMLLWGRHLSRPRDMTEDIDCVLLAEDLPDVETAEKVARDVVHDLRALGFIRPGVWRASRTARFSYPHSIDRVAVDFLCGSLPIGGASRREPAWRIAFAPDASPDFYAAKVPWLDFVEEWITVRARCGRHAFAPRIPELGGLAILKLRAVADKIHRIEDEGDPEVLEREKLRLWRHGRDCMSLFDWIDERGEFDRLARLAAERDTVRSTARDCARWILTHDALVKELDLRGLDRSLERLVPAGP
jgi:hypothetical protein